MTNWQAEIARSHRDQYIKSLREGAVIFVYGTAFGVLITLMITGAV